MTKKQFLIYMFISFTALIVAVFLLLSFLNQPAVQGEMTVVSGDETCGVYSNTIYVIEDEVETTYDQLVLEEIIDDIPSIDIGDEFSVRYTEDYIDDDMLYSMYYLDSLEPMYEETVAFVMPHTDDSYVIRMVCSWGSSDKNKITVENYFIVNYTSSTTSE
ncbi:MAG: hypothetical protein R3Y35_04690 [Clostridia bacterium]